MSDRTSLIQPEQIEQVILLIRGQRGMLDIAVDLPIWKIRRNPFMNGLRMTQLVPVERVERLIHLVRGERCCWTLTWQCFTASPLARLNRAVKRNASRFPPDFMFN